MDETSLCALAVFWYRAESLGNFRRSERLRQFLVTSFDLVKSVKHRIQSSVFGRRSVSQIRRTNLQLFNSSMNGIGENIRGGNR